MIPLILLTANSLCLDHIANILTSDRARPASYSAGYEACAKIVPYFTEQMLAAEAPEIARKHAADMAALKAALAAMESASSAKGQP